MVIFILQRVPTSLRGELTRWTLEPHTGVFIGTMSAMVREHLWQKINTRLRDGAAICIHTTNTEQGFTIRTWGPTPRRIVDYEGLILVETPKKTR